MKKNRIINVLFVGIAMFFMNLSNTYAIDFDVEKSNSNLFSKCSTSNKCVPLCIYGSDEGMISYYYADFENSANGQGWGIFYVSLSLPSRLEILLQVVHTYLMFILLMNI